jgi:hypothetical protein
MNSFRGTGGGGGGVLYGKELVIGIDIVDGTNDGACMRAGCDIASLLPLGAGRLLVLLAVVAVVVAMEVAKAGVGL